ncbi:uncharacterized protein PV07_10853 [Cladophialophora immunda]|uniref:Heterokaryon incompatibility domain-containing protein n=1 Tax=Cladophialophora immunda TaxID=569365 RepID=A0A0D2BU51_9EURO|nr:uncharacterized protein PV07_10853 [Cladophialophora immunda]KIW22568.1 hypothetical protein PV07_10853 [Cladophialophora immunda]OQV02342.1 hypothetical protein CLAIMM_07558 [Cladophialophora immunda]
MSALKRLFRRKGKSTKSYSGAVGGGKPQDGPEINTAAEPVSTDEKSSFRYEALNEQRKEIRLMRALTQPPKKPSERYTVSDYASLPAATTDRKQAPEIIIQTFPLASAPPYTALSYLYGPDVRDQFVACGGTKLPVTSNLEYLLRRLTMFPGWYWADAICIRQDDIAEKNSQVQLMHEIYTAAQKVVAFLGDPPGNMGVETLLALEMLNNMFISKRLPAPESRPLYAQHRARCHRLLSLPYFSRGWIIQEASVNANAAIWYGNADIPIALLSSVVQGIQSESGLYAQLGMADLGDLEIEITGDELMRNFRQADTIGRLRALLRGGDRVPLCRALALGRTSRVTDPRDQIYAFLGFIAHDLRARLKPNYSPENTVEDVLIQCARVGLTSNQALDVLMSAGFTKSQLPSWVPDWTNYPRNAFKMDNYMCASSSSPSIRVDSDNHNTVLLRGAIIDKITKVLKPRKMAFATTPCSSASYIDETPLPEGIPISQRPFFLSLVQDSAYCTLAQEYVSNPYPTGEAPADVVWRTITGDTGLATGGSLRPVQEIDYVRAAAFSHLYRPHSRVAKEFRISVAGAERTALFSLADSYHQQVAYIQEGRRGAMTEKRYLAVLPDTADTGDLVALALGVSMPLIMRKVESEGDIRYRLMGAALVHGIMDGELMEQGGDTADGGWKVKGAQVEDIRIV